MAALAVTPADAAEPYRVTAFLPGQNAVEWQVVNDTVMGGRSQSEYVIEDQQLRYSGYLNTNGGGFAPLRSNRQDWSLEGFTRVRLKVRGDGFYPRRRRRRRFSTG